MAQPIYRFGGNRQQGEIGGEHRFGFSGGWIGKAIHFRSPYIAIVLFLDLAAIIGARLLIGRYYAGRQEEVITSAEIQLAKAINRQELSQALNGSREGTEGQESGKSQEKAE